MAFQQGLSGLRASANALDVTSNNVANAATVGFKSSQAHFADVYASRLGAAGGSQVGIGVSVPAIVQNFSAGNVTVTNNPLDIAINGAGFFRMSDGGSITYSRAGQFHLDKSGYVVDDGARRLTGYAVDTLTGLPVMSTPVELQLDPSDQPPAATGTAGGSFDGVKAVMNFDSRSTVPNTAWAITPPATGPSTSMYNYSTATSIYDSLGNPHTLTIYARKAAAANTWDVYTATDTGAPVAPSTTPTTVFAGPVSVAFNSSGQLTAAPNGVLPLSIALTNGAATPLAFNLDFTGSTQFGANFGVNQMLQDGYAPGRLTGTSVSANGTILGTYTNGQSRIMGQVALSNFTNPDGLASLGGNQWQETSESGSPLTGTPNSASLGVLQSAAVEESNVDLTAELVNMIVEQRNYQANAQTIKTQDQILQTLVNLR